MSQASGDGTDEHLLMRHSNPDGQLLRVEFTTLFEYMQLLRSTAKVLQVRHCMKQQLEARVNIQHDGCLSPELRTRCHVPARSRGVRLLHPMVTYSVTYNILRMLLSAVLCRRSELPEHKIQSNVARGTAGLDLHLRPVPKMLGASTDICTYMLFRYLRFVLI